MDYGDWLSTNRNITENQSSKLYVHCRYIVSSFVCCSKMEKIYTVNARVNEADSVYESEFISSLWPQKYIELEKTQFFCEM